MYHDRTLSGASRRGKGRWTVFRFLAILVALIALAAGFVFLKGLISLAIKAALVGGVAVVAGTVAWKLFTRRRR